MLPARGNEMHHVTSREQDMVAIVEMDGSATQYVHRTLALEKLRKPPFEGKLRAPIRIGTLLERVCHLKCESFGAWKCGDTQPEKTLNQTRCGSSCAVVTEATISPKTLGVLSRFEEATKASLILVVTSYFLA